jgi:hypothetical protein
MRDAKPMHLSKRLPAVAAATLLFASSLVACLLGTGTMKAAAQTPAPPAAAPAPAPAPVQPFQGCVQPLPTDKDTLVLSADSVCATLTGKFSAAKIAGHDIDLKGVLTPRTSTVPASILVDKVVSVGKPCTEVCSLQPPRTRGLGHGGETPGKEGGTPGAAPTSTPPPPQ